MPDEDGYKFCTFCVVPYTRGRERGGAPREVLRQARAQRGYKKIVQLGQTVNSYRHEDASFAGLLRAVAAVEQIRFTSPYPVDFTDELIAAMAELEKVCPFIYLPIQSGSDRMHVRSSCSERTNCAPRRRWRSAARARAERSELSPGAQAR